MQTISSWARGALIAAVLVVTGCETGRAVVRAAPIVRDTGCNAARVVCRWADTACAATGGPAVLPTAGGDDAADEPPVGE